MSGFELDDERLAFERAANFMIEDHPMGAGINIGYLERGQR